MRELDPKDTPELGKKIERPVMPKPNVKVAEGVWKSPDGKLYTERTPPPGYYHPNIKDYL